MKEWEERNETHHEQEVCFLAFVVWVKSTADPVDLNRERSTTFVIVTHNTALAATTNRTYRMTGGRIAVI